LKGIIGKMLEAFMAIQNQCEKAVLFYDGY